MNAHFDLRLENDEGEYVCPVEVDVEVLGGTQPYWSRSYGQYYPGEPLEIYLNRAWWLDKDGRRVKPFSTADKNEHFDQICERVNDILNEEETYREAV